MLEAANGRRHIFELEEKAHARQDSEKREIAIVQGIRLWNGSPDGIGILAVGQDEWTVAGAIDQYQTVEGQGTVGDREGHDQARVENGVQLD